MYIRRSRVGICGGIIREYVEVQCGICGGIVRVFVGICGGIV